MDNERFDWDQENWDDGPFIEDLSSWDEGPFIDPTAELAREAILFCGYELKESAGE